MKNKASTKHQFLYFIFPYFLVIALVFSGCHQHDPTDHPSEPKWSVYFSPNGGCTEAIVDAVNKATSSILVQAYSFTSKPIAEALVKAHNLGVKVEVIVDKSELHGKGAEASFLSESGIPVSVDSVHAIAHNKVMVIDDQTVVTGSFNFTSNAENHNAENLLIIQEKTLADKYTDNWHKHRTHSEGYQKSSEVKLAA